MGNYSDHLKLTHNKYLKYKRMQEYKWWWWVILEQCVESLSIIVWIHWVSNAFKCGAIVITKRSLLGLRLFWLFKKPISTFSHHIKSSLQKKSHPNAAFSFFDNKKSLFSSQLFVVITKKATAPHRTAETNGA